MRANSVFVTGLITNKENFIREGTPIKAKDNAYFGIFISFSIFYFFV